MKDHSNQPPDGSAKPPDSTASKAGVDGSRRRFIKGGAAGAPVILTLTSRPVFGFEQACVAPSRMISGNFSGFDGDISCQGNTREYYYLQVNDVDPGQWPDWAKADFVDMGGPDSLLPYVTTGTGSPKKVGRVLINSYKGKDGNSGSVAGFASYIIAAYQNALVEGSSVATVLKPVQVVHMWNDVVGTAGEYCPQITMCWDANGIIGYFQNSGVVPS
jgi:hypothetical protein